jgi:hypothetical protein
MGSHADRWGFRVDGFCTRTCTRVLHAGPWVFFRGGPRAGGGGAGRLLGGGLGRRRGGSTATCEPLPPPTCNSESDSFIRASTAVRPAHEEWIQRKGRGSGDSDPIRPHSPPPLTPAPEALCARPGIRPGRTGRVRAALRSPSPEPTTALFCRKSFPRHRPGSLSSRSGRA